MDKSGEGNDKQGELGSKTSSSFNAINVPQSKSGSMKTGDKSEKLCLTKLKVGLCLDVCCLNYHP